MAWGRGVSIYIYICFVLCQTESFSRDLPKMKIHDIVVQLCLVLGPSTTQFNCMDLCMSSPCMNQLKNTQTFI